MKIKHLILILVLSFPIMGCNRILDDMSHDIDDKAEPDWPGAYEGLLIVRSSDFEEKFQKVYGSVSTTSSVKWIWSATLSFPSFPMDAGGNKTMTQLEIDYFHGDVNGNNFSSDMSTYVKWNGKEYKVKKITGYYQIWKDKGFRRLMMTVILEDPKIVIEYDGRDPIDPDDYAD